MGADVLAGRRGLEDLFSGSREDSSVRTDYVSFTALTLSGVAGRVALQHVPSVEPIVAVAVATGFYMGMRNGFLSGASAFYISNFLVFGGQGPWTVFQVLGAGLSGAAGGLLGKFSSSRTGFVSSIVLGVMLFESAVNLGSLAFLSFTGQGLGFLAAALPFGLTHMLSSIGFGMMIYGTRRFTGLSAK